MHIRGEVYVINLLLMSQRARDIAAGARMKLGIPAGDITATLRDPGNRDRASEWLKQLSELFASTFEARSQPTFTEDDFLRLVRLPVKRVLARALQCAEDDVLAILLDPIPIARALDDVHKGPLRLRRHEESPADWPDVEWLLISLLDGQTYKTVRRHFGYGENQWGELLDDEEWIRPRAIELLRAEATRRGWNRDAEPSALLAAIIQDASDPSAGYSFAAGDDWFDSMAIAYLRRRLANLASQLREEAVAHAEKAAGTAPDLRSVARLHAWIELYERDAVARGLVRLFGGKTLFATLVAHGRLEDPGIDPKIVGAPLLDEALQVDVEGTFKKGTSVFRRGSQQEGEYATFKVGCVLEGDSQPQTILRCISMPIAIYRQAAACLQGLRGQDLSPVGNTLGERLLNTEVTALGGMAGFLRAAVERNPQEIAQSIVLCDIHSPVTSEVAWHWELNNSLPYSVRDITGDVRFPRNVHQIVQQLSESYRKAGKQVDLRTS